MWRRRKHCGTGPPRKRANKADPDEEETDDRDYAPRPSNRRTKRVFESADVAPATKRGKPRSSQTPQDQQKGPTAAGSTLHLLDPVSFLMYGVDHGFLAAPAEPSNAANQQQQQQANRTTDSQVQSPAPLCPILGPGPEQQPSAVHGFPAATSRHCDSASAQTVLEQDLSSGAQQQQQQQSEYKADADARPAATTTGYELQLGWDDAWDAGTDEATSTIDDDIDAQLLMQLELVLSEEDQQQPVLASPADEAVPCATACHNAWGFVTDANPLPADSGSTGPAVTVTASGSVGPVFHSSAAVAAAAMVDQSAPDNKMELVNQLVDAWYDDAGSAEECEGIDAMAQHLQQQILGQVNSSSNNALAGAAAVPAGVACHAAHAVAAGGADIAAAAASATYSQGQVLTDSPVSAVQRYTINSRQPQQQIQVSGVFGKPAHSASAGPTACSTMRVSAPYPAVSAPAAMPPTAAGAGATAVGRLVLLQQKVQQMSSQLAHLQSAMQKSVEDFVMMNPPQMLTQQMMSQQILPDHVSAGMLTQQMPDQLWSNLSMHSNVSVATTLNQAAMGFRQPQQAGVWA